VEDGERFGQVKSVCVLIILMYKSLIQTPDMILTDRHVDIDNNLRK
jgi:hypothetical protein